MSYRARVRLLAGLLLVLSALYFTGLAREPQRREGRTFGWLEPGHLDLVDRIELFGSQGRVVLVRRNNIWYVSLGREYPALQSRVDELFSALTRRSSYTQRPGNPEDLLSLGLVEGRASRILLSAGAGLPLLDLLLGIGDALGRDAYFKVASADRIYQGEDRFSLHTETGILSWLDLRLFSTENILKGPGMIQEIAVRPPDSPGHYNLRRDRGGWIMVGREDRELDSLLTEAYVRSILWSEGEFLHDEVPNSIEGSLELHFGDGSSSLFMIGPLIEQYRLGFRQDGDYSFVLNQWTLDRLFRDPEYFYK
ncbi:MAG: DUF4340 domain-containing protein [Treponema sp.]|nr:DUF4340 domain-containing protein [Treponema sp.]